METKQGWRASWTRILQDDSSATHLVRFHAERMSGRIARNVDFSFTNDTNTSGTGRDPRHFDVPKGAFVEAVLDLSEANLGWAWIKWDTGSVSFECPFSLPH